jgi:hypothetical protein
MSVYEVEQASHRRARIGTIVRDDMKKPQEKRNTNLINEYAKSAEPTRFPTHVPEATSRMVSSTLFMASDAVSIQCAVTT